MEREMPANLSSRISFLLRKYRRAVIVICVLFVLLCAVITACVLSLRGSSPTSEPHHSKLEYNKEVFYVPVEAAFNSSVDPCEDFYEFACGQWSKYVSHPDPYSRESITSFTLLERSVKDQVKQIFVAASASGTSEEYPVIVNGAIEFYKSCMYSAESGIQLSSSVLELLDKIGGWPLLGNTSWNEQTYSLVHTMSSLHQMLGLQIFIGIYVAVDDNDSSTNILMIKAPEPLDDFLDGGFTSVMLYCMVTGLGSSLSTDEIMSDIKHMKLLLEKLEEFHKSVGASKSERMSIAALQNVVPGINWLDLINSVLNGAVCSDSCVTEHDEIVVRDIAYLRKAVSLFDATTLDKRTFANLFGWQAIADLALLLPEVVKKYASYNGFPESEALPLIKKKCYDKVVETSYNALDYLYIKSTTQFDADKSLKLIYYLKESFKMLLSEVLWLDEGTKMEMFSKLESMVEVVGFTPAMSSKKFLDKQFSDFPTLGSNVIENYLKSSTFFIGKQVGKLKVKNSRKEWILPRPVEQVGAYYNANHNTIVLPLSLHNPPFYYKDAAWYQNFGAIGSMIGHEISHAFDSIGGKRDKKGNLVNWWTVDSISEYKKRLVCFEKQFDKYTIPGSNVTVNGSRTLGENMADSVGLKLMYLAYKLWQQEHGLEQRYRGMEQFTTEQMLFINFASLWCSVDDPGFVVALASSRVHSPSKWRVSGSVSNSEFFAKVFNCKKGSPMNPEEKCAIW